MKTTTISAKFTSTSKQMVLHVVEIVTPCQVHTVQAGHLIRRFYVAQSHTHQATWAAWELDSSGTVYSLCSATSEKMAVDLARRLLSQ